MTRRPKGYSKDDPTWADDYYVCETCGARVTHGWVSTHSGWHQSLTPSSAPKKGP